MYAGDAKAEPYNLIDALSAQLGLDDAEEEGCWPDNWLPLQVFAALGTQWNVGMSGAVGLRYESVEPVMRMMEIKRGDRAELFEALRIMESAALEVMREQRN